LCRSMACSVTSKPALSTASLHSLRYIDPEETHLYVCACYFSRAKIIAAYYSISHGGRHTQSFLARAFW